jgi:threonine/homoserine/homoserine lactone efflux protein
MRPHHFVYSQHAPTQLRIRFFRILWRETEAKRVHHDQHLPCFDDDFLVQAERSSVLLSFDGTILRAFPLARGKDTVDCSDSQKEFAVFDHQFMSFLALALLLTITPGADVVLTIRNSLSGGSKDGLWTMAGICSGFFVQPVLASLGVAALLVNSATAFNLVKFAGAAYLTYLGSRSLLSAWRWWVQETNSEPMDVPIESSKTRRWVRYREGLLTNALNPKIAVFYFAVLPQFINPGDPVLLKSLLMSASHYLIGVVWLSSLALVAGQARELFLKPKTRATCEAISGLTMIGFGLKLATSEAH